MASPEFEVISIVFAAQRSGSTSFCRRVTQQVNLGNPRESFLTGVEASGESFWDRLKLGRTAAAPGSAGAKIMVRDVARALEMLTGTPHPGSDPDAALALADALRPYTEHLLLFGILRQSAIDIAISVACAESSGIWHSNDRVEHGFSDQDVRKLAVRARQILPRVENTRDTLLVLRETLPGSCWFDYDDCAARNFDIGAEIRAYATEMGVPDMPGARAAWRDREVWAKVVDPDLTARVIAALETLTD